MVLTIYPNTPQSATQRGRQAGEEHGEEMQGTVVFRTTVLKWFFIDDRSRILRGRVAKMANEILLVSG